MTKSDRAPGRGWTAAWNAVLNAAAPLENPQKNQLETTNRRAFERDLWDQSLTFRSRPRIVDVQFSNFCNMACTMCYPDGNPPLERLTPSVLRTLVQDVFPHASILVPFVGSEPLIYTWDQTRDIAQRFKVDLDLVTNVQFLDEKKFAEMEPLVSSFRVSIDSHRREVYESIRLQSKPEQVFHNLERVAPLARKHGIEVQANVVFLSANADHLHQTVEFLADLGIPTVHVLQYHYSRPEDAYLDPSSKYSEAEIEESLAKVRDAARAKRVRVVLDLEKKEILDHRAPASYRDNKKNDPWIERMRRFYPGYCAQAANRIKVNANGDVYPCCVADRGQLRLGNLERQPFEEVWNGPEARDLRRAMLTQDLPVLCQNCSLARGWILPEQDWMVFVDSFERALGVDARSRSSDFELQLDEPAHLLRSTEPVTLRWTRPRVEVARFQVHIAQGGEANASNHTLELPGSATEVALPPAIWNSLKSNVGYWWTVWAFAPDSASVAGRWARARTIRCLVRQVNIARVEGSTLYSSADSLFQFSPAAP